MNISSRHDSGYREEKKKVLITLFSKNRLNSTYEASLKILSFCPATRRTNSSRFEFSVRSQGQNLVTATVFSYEIDDNTRGELSLLPACLL